MNDLNHVHLRGRLGEEPRFRTTPTGKTVVSLRVVTETKAGASWHRVEAWEDQAERFRALKTGDAVEVEGRIKYGSYTKEGVKKYTTDIVVHKVLPPGTNTNAAPPQGWGDDDLRF